LVEERLGELLLTREFKDYVFEQEFQLHFCRKADPQSKGKVENVVKYVKQNFLYNRTYFNIDTLNDDALGWLGRTANALPHAFTQKEPCSEWIVELPFLKPHIANIPRATPLNYTVRKDNTISYKSNLYSLPLGTYKGRGSMVALCAEQDELILSSQENEELCRHKINNGRGLKIINTDHKRDKTSVINEMIEQLCVLLENPQAGRDWLDGIRTAKPRYIRDQLMIIRQTIDATSPLLVNKALDYCMINKITSAIDFKTIVAKYRQELPDENHETKIIPINPLNGTVSAGALIQPEISSIEDYQTIIKNKNQL